MKTFEQCCDEVSKKSGFSDISAMIKYHQKLDPYKTFFRFEEICKLYAQSAKAEAWEEGYNYGASDGQSYCSGYPQKALNPYKS